MAAVSRDDLHDSPSGPSLTAWLRAVLWGALLIPFAGFVVAAFWGYQRVNGQAETEVAKASALALRQAERTFAVAGTVARRADAATAEAGPDPASNESELHRRLADMSAGLPAVVNLNVWDAAGRPLVRSDLYPVGATTPVADRAYFIEQRDHPKPIGVSEVLSGRQTGRELFNVTVRRERGDGTFDGVVAVSLSPDFFRDYYASLAFDEPSLASFVMVRTDGAILARWPKLTDGRTAVDSANPLFARIRAGVDSGVVVLPRSGDGEARLVSFRRVPGLPVYVTAGYSRASIFTDWLRFVAFLSLVFVPITAGLVYVTWVALKKTQREQRLAADMREQMQLRARAERAILETQKLEVLSQLTGGVAHDFNNLLTVVGNNLHILARRHPALATERPLDSILRAVKTGVRLTRQLLSFARKQALRPEVVELRHWLPATEALIRSTLARNVSLDFLVDEDTRPVTVDVAELELALINTVLNAQHAMPDGGTLHITARNAVHAKSGDRAMVAICVEDDGVGIAPDVIARVFEPFFTTRGPGKGSGLGLSQVSGFCEQAGGFATIDSTVGRGTVVGMYVPASETATPGTVEPGASAPEAIEGSVLLVEDNDEVALVTEHLLRAAGLAVTRVADAHAALARLSKDHDRLDVVLSDISMPGTMDGIGLALEVRSRWPALPVLLVTGYAERIHEAIAAGLRVLAKPVAPDDVLREITMCLRRKQARRP